MTNKPLLASIAAFVGAGALAFGTAILLANVAENRTHEKLSGALDEAGLDWAQVETDGLTVALSGTAPDESARIRALQVAGEVVDASRVSETIVVTMQTNTAAPVFRIELMRHGEDLSVIGLVPTDAPGAPLPERLLGALPQAEVADMLQSASHVVPRGWDDAVAFAVAAVELFEVGRISVAEGRVDLEALVSGPTERTQLESALRELAPAGQILSLNLNMPRPVATPFLMRVDLIDGEMRLGACSADTEGARDQITQALRVAGFTGRLACPLALGAPSPRWGTAAAEGIAALADLGAGRFDLSDAEAMLSVPHNVSNEAFDRAVGRLEQRLPEAFVLRSEHLPAPAQVDAAGVAAAEVSMSLSDDGQLEIAGRLPNDRIRNSVRTFAHARFGSDAVDLTTRLDDSLPIGWSVRVLTALEAMAELHHGRARMTADELAVYGVSGNPDVLNQVTQVLRQGLGEDAGFTLAISYDEAFDPVLQAPTPENCERQVREVLAETKITFDPGSTRINEASGHVMDNIAEILRECGELPLEVAGYTDSQGAEETNQRISQARAEAVVDGLLQRRVLIGELVARGYGPADPIADNGTEAGREANRRIEIRLIRPEPDPLERNPELEAELVFEVQTPDADTVRPRARPGDEAPEELAGEQEAAEQSVSSPEAGDEGSDEAGDEATATPPSTPVDEDVTVASEADAPVEQGEPPASTDVEGEVAPEADVEVTDPTGAESASDDGATVASDVVVDAPAAAEPISEDDLTIDAQDAGRDDPRPQPRPANLVAPDATAEN